MVYLSRCWVTNCLVRILKVCCSYSIRLPLCFKTRDPSEWVLFVSLSPLASSACLYLPRYCFSSQCVSSSVHPALARCCLGHCSRAVNRTFWPLPGRAFCLPLPVRSATKPSVLPKCHSDLVQWLLMTFHSKYELFHALIIASVWLFCSTQASHLSGCPIGLVASL